MGGLEIASLTYIGLWVLVGVGFGMFTGFILGRLFTLKNESRKLSQEREVIQSSLVHLIDNTEKMTSDVDSHNRSLATVEMNVKQMEAVESLVDLQEQLLHNIQKVVTSNRKMESDLAITKYQLENQAQELDRSRREARTDSLCDVGNRKAFQEAISYWYCVYQAEQKSFGLMLVDLDHFKRINDSFGHDAGDRVLISVGKILKECVRPEDVVTRIGGDEFAVLLKGVNAGNSELVANRIRETVQLYNFEVGSGDASTVATMSLGMAVIDERDTVTDLYKRADKALYKSKELGRNRLYTINSRDEVEAEMEGNDSMNEEDSQLFPNVLPTDNLGAKEKLAK